MKKIIWILISASSLLMGIASSILLSGREYFALMFLIGFCLPWFVLVAALLVRIFWKARKETRKRIEEDKRRGWGRA